MRIKPFLTLALVFALAACDRGAEAQAPVVRDSVAEAPAHVRAGSRRAAAVEDGREVQPEEMFGTWRVTGVVPDAGSDFARDDPRVMGALMDLYEEKLGWSYLPGKGFAPNDTCLGPVSGRATGRDAQALRAELAPVPVSGPAPRISAPHRWMCGDGGEWGGEAAFRLSGPDDMAMRWPGGVTLVLHRIQRASKDPPALPPTGAYEDPGDAR